MEIPQILMIGLLTAALAIHYVRDGRTYPYNGLNALLVNLPLMLLLLFLGDFFAVMEAPQIIMIVLMTVNTVVAALKHEDHGRKYNFVAALLDTPITVGLLWWGGFWY